MSEASAIVERLHLILNAARQKGLSEAQASRLAGIAGGVITRWKSGENSPKPESIKRLAKAVGDYQPSLEEAERNARQNEEIVRIYGETGSVWKTGARLGLNGQFIQKRLAALGIARKRARVSAEERAQIRSAYESSGARGTIGTEKLMRDLNLSRVTISRCARSMGLTTAFRPLSEDQKASLAEGLHRHLKEVGHPRGALGMVHTEKTKSKMSKASIAMWENMTEDKRIELTRKGMKTRSVNGTLVPPRPNASWKAAWREIGGKRNYYRSAWEANYGRYLEWLKSGGHIKDWKHEPKTFWFDGIKRGCVSYLPDFLVIENNGTEAYHEVKGWMDDRSATKIKRMAKYYPKVKLVVIDAKQYRSLKSQVGGIVPGWETVSRYKPVA